MNTQPKPLVEVCDVKTYFPIKSANFFQRSTQYLKAVDGVSFNVFPGEVLGLVGESGCGKSTIGRTLLRLETANSGTAFFDGQEMLSLPEAKYRKLRRSIQMIFQDPFSSLNPRLSIEQTLAEGLRIHGICQTKAETRQTIGEILNQVGLDSSVMKRYPHEFSGGQRQRIGIARVMMLAPKLIVADEAVSALDVSIQAQILNLLKELQRKSGVAILFISHDLGVVRHISDRVAVMYLGKIVEIGSKLDIFQRPTHPYTQLLLSSIPSVTPGRERIRDLGEPAHAASPPSGCAFHPRCPLATALCSAEAPKTKRIAENHFSSCHHSE